MWNHYNHEDSSQKSNTQVKKSDAKITTQTKKKHDEGTLFPVEVSLRLQQNLQLENSFKVDLC